MTGFDLYVIVVVVFTVLAIIGKLLMMPKREKTELEVKVHDTSYRWVKVFFKWLGLFMLFLLAIIVLIAIMAVMAN